MAKVIMASVTYGKSIYGKCIYAWITESNVLRAASRSVIL